MSVTPSAVFFFSLLCFFFFFITLQCKLFLPYCTLVLEVLYIFESFLYDTSALVINKEHLLDSFAQSITVNVFYGMVELLCEHFR